MENSSYNSIVARMNCQEDILKFFKKLKFNYIFDDDVKYGKGQFIKIDYSNKYKIFTSEDIESFYKGLPKEYDLKMYNEEVYNQETNDIAISCAISSAIQIRTNYINGNRYTITRFLFGNKFSPIKPSKLYIYWNANVDNIHNINSTPSIASYLTKIESHKIVDVKYYKDSYDSLGMEPDLNAFYKASKSMAFEWFKLKSDLNTFKVILNKGYPILAGIVVYQDMLDMKSYQFGIVNTPDYNYAEPVGAHVILLVGYDDNREVFHFLNSWGKNWGDLGYGTIAYEYILNEHLAGDFCYITYKGY